MKSRLDTLQERWRRLQGDSRLRRWVSIGVMLLTIGFSVVLLIHGREELRQFDDWHAYLIVCGQGFLLYPLSMSVQALTWSMMIARLGQIASGWRDIEIYAYTHLMRRLPGPLWYLAGRTVIYRERGIGAGVTLAASGLEWLLLLVAAVSIYGGLSLSGPGSWLLGFIMITLLIIGSLWGLRAALNSVQDPHWLPGFARHWLGRLSVTAMPQIKHLALWVGLYTIAYIIGGLILFLLMHGVTPESNVTLTDAIRIWALTGGISFLTSMIVPAGMGIRELTLTALLAPEVSTVAALLIALLLRMLFIAGDLVWGGLMWAIAQVLGRDQQDAGTRL